MTPLERTLTAMSGREPDRVPCFLTLNLHGAREMGMSIEEYFSKAANVAEGQTRLVEKYQHDCLIAAYYGSLDAEAWGGSTIFLPDGPPQCGRPVIASPMQIDRLQVPRVEDSASLMRAVETIARLKARFGDEYPIVGMVIAPPSLPILQLGFSGYLDLIADNPERWQHLLECNLEFAIAWSNAQLAAGATAIAYADPCSSTTVFSADHIRRHHLPLLRRYLAAVQGPVALALASGRSRDVFDDLASSGIAGLMVSTLEDLAELKQQAAGKLTLLGNLNGVTMRNWSQAEAEMQVKEAIRKAGRGGGFVLCDNHGELPWQIPDHVVHFLREATEKWGRYPLTWIEEEARTAQRGAP